MDLDLAQVRGFVVAAERANFGGAADELHISQQALSKRVRRLEAMLGERLFRRHGRGVELTPAGRRFLPHARRLLADAEEAAAAVRSASVPPLRVDVWSEILTPLTVVRRVTDADPDLAIEVSARRDLAGALKALQRREVDAVFGRVHDLGRPWPSGLDRRPVVLAPYQVALSARHPLAGREVVGPDDLRATGVWFPFGDTAPELRSLLRAYCDEHGVPAHLDGVNLGLEHILAELRDDPARVATIAGQWTLPEDSGLRTLRVEPVPCLLWSLAWRKDDRHPLLPRFLDRLAALGDEEGWLRFDPASHWLPPADRADL
ncbi:LysR family transcriptional regulator [Spirillospora sp. CA-294931]|uniref:LysR family transcriptional regulator n=1 Tax=Spirillospora sp. CA-294931 TaxID=3240042 RepID=UPI003D8E9DBD